MTELKTLKDLKEDKLPIGNIIRISFALFALVGLSPYVIKDLGYSMEFGILITAILNATIVGLGLSLK